MADVLLRALVGDGGLPLCQIWRRWSTPTQGGLLAPRRLAKGAAQSRSTELRASQSRTQLRRGGLDHAAALSPRRAGACRRRLVRLSPRVKEKKKWPGFTGGGGAGVVLFDTWLAVGHWIVDRRLTQVIADMGSAGCAGELKRGGPDAAQLGRLSQPN